MKKYPPTSFSIELLLKTDFMNETTCLTYISKYIYGYVHN